MSMILHFLNVGNGDCTIIELPDNNVMMVDICNGGGTNSEKTDPIRYLYSLRNRQFLLSRNLIYYVQTHPDMDHMDGLAELYRKYEISNFLDTDNNKPCPDFSSPYSKGKPVDWEAYQQLRQNASYFYRSLSPITVQGQLQLPYEIYVLHPTEQAVINTYQSQEWNSASYVLLIKEYSFKALIAGDIDDSVWEELHNWVIQDQKARALVSNIWVFKVSHHGRVSGYCGANWLSLTNPKEIVISKGSVPGEQSAYGNYYNYKNGAEHLWLTSKRDVICRYNSWTNLHSINYWP